MVTNIQPICISNISGDSHNIVTYMYMCIYLCVNVRWNVMFCDIV